MAGYSDKDPTRGWEKQTDRFYQQTNLPGRRVGPKFPWESSLPVRRRRQTRRVWRRDGGCGKNDWT